MVFPANGKRSELHWVVLVAQPCCGEQKPQNLWIGSRGPARNQVQQRKHQDTSEQASEQIERSSADAHGAKKELPLGPENCQRPAERAMDRIEPPCSGHDVTQERATTGN